MPDIVPIVEGDGEVLALPGLLTRLLQDAEQWDIGVGSPKNAHGIDNLVKPGGVEKFVRYAMGTPRCGAVLILLDSDKRCALELARALAERVQGVGITRPVVIVAAKCEYEAWFIASLETVRQATHLDFPAGVRFDDDPESVVGAKGWLSRQLPKNQAYSETRDQPKLTSLMDLELTRNRSRSFRRLCSALRQAVEAIGAGEVIVTPE